MAIRVDADTLHSKANELRTLLSNHNDNVGRMRTLVNNLSGGMWGNVDSSKGMRRLHYPQSEYDNNRENVLRGVELLGGSDLHGTDVWWAKK